MHRTPFAAAQMAIERAPTRCNRLLAVQMINNKSFQSDSSVDDGSVGLARMERSPEGNPTAEGLNAISHVLVFFVVQLCAPITQFSARASQIVHSEPLINMNRLVCLSVSGVHKLKTDK